ncbi:MAG: hypothetical protein E7366_00370 [Clostridiales bacterium]|nr:hypothetical protein [Clostridiales bacterium]
MAEKKRNEKKKEKTDEKINDALLKVALGYQVAEVTEEYAEVDGELKLTKRKKTKKDVPPDLKAVQMLLANEGNDEYGAWTDEELEKERVRLLAALEESKAGVEKEERKKTVKAKTGAAVKRTKKK